MAGKAGRSGPKKGNVNAAKNGSRIAKTRLVIGELPKQLLSVRREARSYRRHLEAEVLRVHGEITAMHAHAIDTAAAATVSAAIARWLMRNKIGGMSTSEVLSCSKAILQSKQARDSAVKLLGLDAPPPAPWAIDVPSEEPADA